MSNIFNNIYILLTAPGIILHEISHKLFCHAFKIPVYKVNYFSLSAKDSGSVTYKKIYRLLPTFFINIGPLLINTICAILLMLILTKIGLSHYLNIIIYWLAICFALHAIPSIPDINNILIILKKRKRKPIVINGVVKALEMVSPLRYYGFDLFYAYILIKIVPTAIASFFCF